VGHCDTAAAQTAFGWRVGPTAWSFNRFSFFDAVDKTAALGMGYIEAFEGQRVRPESEALLDASLPDETIQQIRAKLEETKVRLISLYVHDNPADEAGCRHVFEFAKKLGIEVIVSEPAPEALDVIEKCCNEFAISLAIHNHPEGHSRYWNPQEVLRACEGRGPRIGACGDTGHWLRSGLKPVDAVRLLGNRLLTLHLKDLDRAAQDAADVPWGQGAGEIEAVLRAVEELRLRPALFGIEYESDWENNSPQIDACGKWFQQAAANLAASVTVEAPLYAGWASVDITPPKPAALIGQLHKRISTGVLDPLTATALALETRGPNGETEQAILLSCDLGMTLRSTTDRLRDGLAARLPDFDPRKLMVNATHTHTAPGLADSTFKGLYDVSNDPGVMTASEYGDFFIERAVNVVAEAWQNRVPASMNWALGSAAVGINRRTQYFDGTARMYGDTRRDDFKSFEGSADPGVELLFFWGPGQTLTGMIINIACPTQETEGLSQVSADFWHDVRQEIRRRHGENLFILPQIAAAGDNSPHCMFRKDAESIMLQRRSISRRQEIARRIVNAVDEVLPTANTDAKSAICLRHDVVALDLPEVQEVRTPFYETDSVHPIQFHVLRIGDVGMATNPFELFLDYGLRIQARSKPVLTFLVQLCDSQSGYLPTAEAIAGGGYSADNFVVRPEGGQLLVDVTVSRLNFFWP
jgi:sugar phosphate isomerase/epimerase